MNLTSEAYVPRNVLVIDNFDVPDVTSNRGAVVLSVGLTSGLHLTTQLALPTGSDIARHGVQLDLVIGFDFGLAAGDTRDVRSDRSPR